ncbi:hypothetical protein Ahy_B02g058470 isoform A [Arachis hypogaea]|uniref:Uncharacterized protein n=1 Tax=Arachis hypogaea TaxID=3818 RepID=A0A445AER3_ARAHY|nr:hypothetical protein Ahy_B02g058470 isoform A [Arachis hypogaea]
MLQFVRQLYEGVIILDELHGHLELLEYVEWHPANRVMQQFRYAQPAPEVARVILLEEHCMTFRGNGKSVVTLGCGMDTPFRLGTLDCRLSNVIGMWGCMDIC